MESKVSLKDRLRRTRSAIFSFGSQVIQSHISIQTKLVLIKQKQSTEKPDRYPYFRGPPSQRQSSICERQLISKPVERELRYACYLLQRNIAHGVPSTDGNQDPEQQVVAKRAPSTQLRPQSSVLPTVLQAAVPAAAVAPAPAPAPVSDKRSNEANVQKVAQPYKAHDYDADPWHRWSGIAIPTGPQGQVHSDNTSRIPSSSMKSTRDAASDMPFSSGETLVGGTDGQQDRRAHVRVPANIQDDPESETNEEKEQQKNAQPQLEGSSRLVRKKRMENLHESSVRESSTTTTPATSTTTNTTTSNGNNNGTSNATSVSARSSASRPSAPRARYSWLPRTGIRPASTIEVGSQRRPHDPVTVAVGTGADTGAGTGTGIRRTAADEEQARQNDLQQAVWEKMATGRIGSRSRPRPMSTTAMAMGLDDTPKTTAVTVDRRTASSPLTCLDTSHKHKPVFPVSVPVPEPGAGLPAGKAATGTFQPVKRKSIMRKLAFLGFGKQKNKETAVGYSQTQIVEAA